MTKQLQAYIRRFPLEHRLRLRQVYKIIRLAAPTAEETISYGIPTFKLNGKNLVHFGAFKHHIGFYPTSSGIKHFKHQFKGYEYSKGAIQLPIEGKIPVSILKRIVKFRVKEVFPELGCCK